MNYMKQKYFKKELLVCLLIIFLIGLCSCKKQNNLKFLISPTIYNLLEPSFEVIVYLNQEHSPYMKKEYASNIQLLNNQTEENYPLLIKNIYELSNDITYNKEKFYSYSIEFTLPFSQNFLFIIEEAFVEIDYQNQDQLILNIGSIAYIKNDDNSTNVYNLEISKLFGIVNEINQRNTLCGIILSLNNKNDIPLYIKKITLVNPFAKTNYDYITVLETIPNDHNQSMDSILGRKYLFNNQNRKEEINLLLDPNEQKNVIIPLSYHYEKMLNQTAIIIEFMGTNKEELRIINNFKFFESYDMSSLKEVKI